MTDLRDSIPPRRPECARCSLDSCLLKEVRDPTQCAAGALQGWRLSVAALGLLLGPVALALLGAAALGPSATGQLVGGVGGLAGGLAACVLAGRALLMCGKAR